MSLERANIGCGSTPTPGWRNFDNSWSVRLARHPFWTAVADRLGFLGTAPREFASFAAHHDIEWANASRRIPLPDGSLEVLYTSHMLEHLDRAEARRFLREARRVLAAGGILRIAVPDLRRLVERYRVDEDADALLERSLLTSESPSTMRDAIRHLIVGGRHHRWMYDARSLCRLVQEAGFEGARAVEPGVTSIPDPGALDLFERADESVYVEAFR